jgi:hypothetical protein
MLKCNKIMESIAPNLEGRCVFDLKATAYFIATIHFLETRLHGRLELEEAPFGSLRKNRRIGRFTSPTHVYMVCDPSRTRSLCLHKPPAQFP